MVTAVTDGFSDVSWRFLLLPHQTPSDWLIKYFAVRRRAGKGCLCDDGEEDEGAG